jgi:glutaminyl-peptide cyclotransferase
MRLKKVMLSASRLTLACLALLSASCSDYKKQQEIVETARGLYNYDAQQAVHPQFSGEKALGFAKAQADIGPRPSGSEAAERARQHLISTLQSHGWEVERQAFKDYTPKGNIEFQNIRARFPATGSETWKRAAGVLLGSHYDTKLFNFPFIGANDGASSTGALLEISRVLSARPALAQFVELVFFDGEEAVVEYTTDANSQLPKDGLYGSRHYAKSLKEQPAALQPIALLLLDMVGEKDIRVKIPDNCHRGLSDAILQAANELKYGTHFGRATGAIVDDHLPFHVAGLPCVDIIDIEYPVWHTQGDTMDQLSAQSLEMVGRTTLLALEKTVLATPKW